LLRHSAKIGVDFLLKISDDNLMLKLLKVYEFEVPRVAGPHGGRPGFNPWSKEEIINANPDINVDGGLDDLLDLLKQESQLLVIPEYGDNPERYLTRTAEMVRTIGTIHEYVARETDDDETESNRHLQIIEATKWVPTPMERPARVVPIDQFCEGLSEQMEINEINTVRGLPKAKILELVKLVLLAIQRGEKIPGEFKLTKFQDRAITSALLTSWMGRNDSPIIICAGTGSGKTIGFTVPVLLDAIIDTIVQRNRDVEFSGRWTQLMVYPRNDLAFDQYQTLSNYCGELNNLLHENNYEDNYLAIALDAGGYIKTYNEKLPKGFGRRTVGEWDKQSGKSEWGDNTNVVSASSRRYGGVHESGQRVRPANIMIVSSESFRRRLAIPAVVQAVKNIQRVVLDEIHLAEGINGGHLRGLFNRLSAIKDGKKPLFIAASATIAEESNHVKAIWGSRGEVQVIKPTFEEKQGRAGGIANHVLVRPRAGVTKGGPVYNTTSLVGHQSKSMDWAENRELASDDLDLWDKILCFADSREFVGRWQMIMNENEGSMHKMRITDRKLNGYGTITLPYAHWFDRPLAQQLGHDKVCKACEKGCKLPNDIDVQVSKIRHFKTKWGGQRGTDPEYFMMENWGESDDDFVKINSLDQCPHLIAGTCWHFAPGIGVNPIITEDNALAVISENLIQRPGTGNDKVLRNTLRFRRHHAESKDNKARDGLSTDEAQFSAAEHYRHNSGEAYPSLRPGDYAGHKQVIHDGVIATPTLEVGVDMKNLGTVLTHRAMRNRASYRQKAGRAGREEGSVSNIVTILSRRPGDYQFYRDEQSLIVDELREIVPVAHRNRMIMRSQAYMSVLDWLALEGVAIEMIGHPNWISNMKQAVDKIRLERQKVYTFIWNGFKFSDGLEPVDVYTAIDTMYKHLDTIASGEYSAKGEEEKLSIAEQLARANQGKRQRGSNPDQVLFARPDSAAGGFDKDALKEAKNYFGEVKRLFSPELNHRISELFSDIENWASNVDPNRIDHLISLCEGLIGELDELKKSFSIIDKRNIGKFAGKIRALKEELEYFDPNLVDESDDAQSLAKNLDPKGPDGINNNSSGWWYLSWLLGECQTFLDDAPYCYVEKVFINPQEAQIDVQITGKKHPMKQSMSQFMRDLLPGTWSFRLAAKGGGHACKSPVGGEGVRDTDDENLKTIMVSLDSTPLKFEDDIGYSLHVDTVNGETISYSEIPNLIRMGHDSNAIKIIRPKRRVYLRYEDGLTNKVEEGIVDNIPSKINYSEEGGKLVWKMDTTGNNGQDSGMIPESWPCRWAISESRSSEHVVSYSPSHRSVSPVGTAGRHSVIKHPLNTLIFDDISKSEEVHVKDIVIGVHRGPRGLALRYQTQNDDDVVFGRIISTKGIVHKVSQEIKSRIDHLSDNWNSELFDRDSLKQIQHHLEQMNVCSDTERFSNKDLTNILLLQFFESDKKLPSSIGEAISFWQENDTIESDVVNKYLAGIQPHVRELVEEGLTNVINNYHSTGPALWNSFAESLIEWKKYTLLNTLGKIYVEAASSFTGVQEEKISYSINLEKMQFTLFDDDAEGNGCCESIWRHYQVSEASRAAAGQMRAPPPPDKDFVSIVQQRLLTCKEHVVHRLAFDLKNGLEIPRNLGRTKDSAESILKSHGAIWSKLELKTVREAELLSHLSAVMRNEHYPDRSVDEIDQALHVCATGCFICEGAPMASALPLSIASRYTSRKLVDDMIGFGPEQPGYSNARDRTRSIGASTERPPEVFPHYRHRNYSDDYQHRIPVPFTPLTIPVTLKWFARDTVNPLPKPIRMERVVDHLEGGVDSDN